MTAATTIGLFIIPVLFVVIERLAEWVVPRPKLEAEQPMPATTRVP